MTAALASTVEKHEAAFAISEFNVAMKQACVTGPVEFHVNGCAPDVAVVMTRASRLFGVASADDPKTRATAEVLAEVASVDAALRGLLSDIDPFWADWRWFRKRLGITP